MKKGLLPALFAAIAFSSAASSQVTVVGNLVQEQEAVSGAKYQGTVILRNDGTNPVNVRAYITDYRFTADGRSEFAEGGTTARSNGQWITLSSRSIVLSPKQSTALRYAVDVPVSLPDSAMGSYWSVIMIEPEISPVKRRPGTVDIKTVTRQGVQVVTHVGHGAARITFANVKTGRDSSAQATLQFDVGNSGTRARKLRLSVDIYDEEGRLVTSLAKQRGIVYPGCSIRQLFSLESLKKGTYSAFLVADAADDDLFAGKFRLTF